MAPHAEEEAFRSELYIYSSIFSESSLKNLKEQPFNWNVHRKKVQVLQVTTGIELDFFVLVLMSLTFFSV